MLEFLLFLMAATPFRKRTRIFTLSQH